MVFLCLIELLLMFLKHGFTALWHRVFRTTRSKNKPIPLQNTHQPCSDNIEHDSVNASFPGRVSDKEFKCGEML